jgi:SAM-dependent methyltransferase
LKINFFDNIGRTNAERSKILAENDISFTDNYMNFGYDYFDNQNIHIGYGGYEYDGRYETPVQKIIENYNLKENSKVLELGCAKGFLLYEFYKKNMIVTGIDISSYAKNNCILEIKDRIINADASDGIPFENKHFDLIISKDFLPHVNQDKLVFLLKECQRVSHSNFHHIQCGHNDKQIQDLVKWDKTHKSTFSEEKWMKIFVKAKYTGNYFFKSLT